MASRRLAAGRTAPGRRALAIAVVSLLGSPLLVAAGCSSGDGTVAVDDESTTTSVKDAPAGDCGALTLAYTGLVVVAFTSEDPETDVEDVLDEVRERLPEDLLDDLQVVGDAYASIRSSGFDGASTSLSDPEFVEANDAIAGWLREQCER